MNNDDIAIKFSDTTYASKSEVSRAMQIAQIDVIWSHIMQYRSHFTINLPLRNIEKTPYVIVLSPTIMNKVIATERKLSKLMLKYMKLRDDDYVKYDLRLRHYTNCLLELANNYDLGVTSDFITNIVSGNASSISPKELVLQNYFLCLTHIEKYPYDPLNENTLLNFARYLDGVSDLGDLYRKSELDNDNHFGINRIYSGAPLSRIEPMMSDLFAFVQDDNLPALVRAIVAFYYINYAKPFEVHSEEIAILLLKSVLAHSDFEGIAPLLSFEFLMSKKNETILASIKEVEKTNDLTYLVTKVFSYLDESIDMMLDALAMSNAQSIKEELYVFEETENQQSYQEVMEKESKVLHNIDYEVKVALPKLSIGLDEKDAVKIAEHLVEMNPKLKKGEALFYARHCTIGKYYTIQQFKAMNECAYETARTSMDHLASEGFYQKEMIKNKFVYTPIPRK